MRSYWLGLAVIVFCSPLFSATLFAADELSDQEKKDGYVSLFNGQDLTNWRFDEESPPTKLPENWKVEEGVIKVTGGGSPHLASAKEYVDFEFRFEWRGMKPKYNSGLFIRSGKKVGAHQINLASGGEGNFLNGKLTGGKPVPMLQKPAGEWNEWQVRCVGDKVTFHCNGQLAWEGTGLAAKSGYLGLQAEGAPLEFRKLRILEIK
ncbi:3-keto-disaccharide hydrolase [Anatilimnocola floriformis]|uniref:3-keto-disaccharide hydrolase n=1 Tax=Anatilimnocola floriformis TaxID=2948575 RepID=UPI0020C1EB7C|nr:DUF1080 domain-containing protein [Anatilimnocola floriformis]